MKRQLAYLYCLVLFVFPGMIAAQSAYVITVDATINPATASFIERSIQKAADENAVCLIIQLDTPGGLLESTRDIIGAIMNAEIPVCVYVSPSGAHAGSAGVFITLSAHVAAMAPGTNIGAAHPVEMQGSMDSTMASKVTQDATALIRTIAQKRNRNVEWAEDAVRKSVSITANEALDKGVIDLVVLNNRQLLNEMDGKTVEVGPEMQTLHTKGATLVRIQMHFIEKLLNVLSNPNVAYILLMFGFYGILFELYSPGAILPGIIGVISLILGFYALNNLPLNYAGLGLILFGIVLFLLEIKVTSYGMLTIGGIISLALGSAMLIRPESTFALGGISSTVIATTTIVTAAFFIFVIGMGLRAQRAKPVMGPDSLINETGVAIQTLDPNGNILVHGEIWKAESVSGTIPENAEVKVTGRQHFTLYVEQISNP